jgi:hypothetical protein
MNSPETYFSPAIEGLGRLALNRQCPKTVRIRCLRELAQYYPLPGGEQPTKEALSELLYQLDQLGASTLSEKTKGI